MGNRRVLKEMKKGQLEWETGECSRRLRKDILSGKQENAQGDEERTSRVENRRALREMKKGQLEWEIGERSRR